MKVGYQYCDYVSYVTVCISLLLTHTEVGKSLQHSSAIFTMLEKPEASTAAGHFFR